MKTFVSYIGQHKFEIIVDANKYDELSKFNWVINYMDSTFSVHTKIKKQKIFLHRYLTNCPKGMVVDHINGNGLDNRLNNLRICTVAQNNMNSSKPKNKTCSSNFIGVSYDYRYTKKWRASMSLNNKSVYIGSFETELEAAKARDIEVLKHRGQYARVNFPKEK